LYDTITQPKSQLQESKDQSLNFKLPGWYLEFCAWFMKNVLLFEQKKLHYEINGIL
jgi:hypothetical protein